MPADARSPRAADVFRAELDAVISAIRAWRRSIADVARTTETAGEDFWRVTVEPLSPHACPCELILHRDQHFDLAVGSEVYERRPIGESRLIPLLLQAIGEGRVTARTLLSPNTGAARSLETIIRTADGGTWRCERLLGNGAGALAPDAYQARDRHYAPYRLR
jgi:hypothetical protein